MSNIYSQRLDAYKELELNTSELATMCGFFKEAYGFDKDSTEENLKEFLSASSTKIEDLQAAAEKFHADKNPAPKFARILSTYNLKALFTGAAAYGSFVFGLTPIGLVLAGATAFFAAKFAQAHYSAYKSLNVEYSSLYGADDALTAKIKGSVKNGFFNTVEFLKAVTYGSAAKGMLESTIAKKEEGSSFYQLGVLNSEESEKGFDLKTLGLDAVAALGSALALIYAPISAPLYRLMTAVLPMLVTSPLGNYAMAPQTAKAKGKQSDGTGKGNDAPLPSDELPSRNGYSVHSDAGLDEDAVGVRSADRADEDAVRHSGGAESRHSDADLDEDAEQSLALGSNS